MEQFVQWYNKNTFPLKGEVAEAVLRSAVAHLYFESIHPFEDGNGRIGRAIAENALSQSLGRPVMLSLSKITERNKGAYYDALKNAQGTMEITNWVNYFAAVILEAQRDARAIVQFTLKKAKFFDRYKHKLNERQLKAVNKMLEKATATRDLQELQVMGVFVQEGAGRSIRYQLNVP